MHKRGCAPDVSSFSCASALDKTGAHLHVLVVCHCYRENVSVIRIISARKANKQEQSDYWS